jgi:hypothetical protein
MRYGKGFGYQTEGDQNTEKRLATRTNRDEVRKYMLTVRLNKEEKSMLFPLSEREKWRKEKYAGYRYRKQEKYEVSILAFRKRNKEVLKVVWLSG